jgi:hypothetical protein
VKLKEYMGTHEGEYSVAESTRPLTVKDLDRKLGDLEVEAYLLGTDGRGRRKFHLYTTDRPLHLVTHIEGDTPSEAAWSKRGHH